MFPHGGFPDAPYARAAAAVRTEAASEPLLLGLLAQGIHDLDALGGRPFVELDEAEATGVLQRMESTPFFQQARDRASRWFYDDQEVRALLGYEGASFHLGGYVERGFDDLDWLPEPPL
jgi:hypothetical protein